ncbi:MAG: response regulator [Rubrivivax sp.]|nr:response regulator [Rubrivivax sp.]
MPAPAPHAAGLLSDGPAATPPHAAGTAAAVRPGDAWITEAVNRAGIAVWRRDLSSDLLVGSDAFFRLLEMPVPPGPIPSQTVRRMLLPEEGERAAELTAALLASGQPQESLLRYRLDSGRVLQLLTRRTLLRDTLGRPQAVLAVTLDVTDHHVRQQDAERELADARERVALAVSGAGIGTWEWWPQTGQARWDENMYRLRGMEPGDRAPTHDERMALIHPEDRGLVAEVLAQRAGAGPTLATEFRIVRPDGQVRWLASRSATLTDPETGEARRIGVNWDITDRRVAEQARRDAEVALRESHAKSQFLARMSHELRTPLNAVLGFSQLLLAEAAPGTAGAGRLSQRESLEHIRRAGRHLLSLVDDVLDLARIEGGELTLVREPVRLADLVSQALPMVAPQAESAGVHLRADTAALEHTVLADTRRLRQVLLNLLSNGIKYNRSGGQVAIDAEAAGALVRLRVRDNGRGIAADRLPELFQPFNRLGAEREAIEGTGIGLAIVKSLVEHMGGHVQVHSRLGEGSVFEVLLPRPAARGERPSPSSVAPATDGGMPAHPAQAAAAAAFEGPVPGAAPATARRRRLLYIEDNEVNALIVSELLATVPGYELVVAVDGTRGLAAAQHAPPELVLLDMQLPDMDGFEVLRRLRESPATASLPVVALSANVMPDQVRRGMAAGLADYWAKPLDVPLFLQRLGALLPPLAGR